MKRNIMATLGLIVCLWGINVCADDVQHYMDSAETKNVNGDYIGAVEECNKAIELDPKYEPAYFFRGFIKSRSHDYKGALEDLNKAKELGYYKADVEIKRMQKDNGNTDNQMDKTPNRAKQYRSVMDCIQDGWKYEGESIDGVPNGKGVLTTPDGEDKFEGQFQNGKLVKGSIFMKNRGILTGNFNGSVCLTGIFIASDLNEYKFLVFDDGPKPLMILTSCYCIVDHKFKGDKGNSKELLEVAIVNQDAANRVIEWSEFWLQKPKAVLENRQDDISRQIIESNPHKTQEEITKMAQAKGKQLYSVYVYDHWDEINNSAKVLIDSIQKDYPSELISQNNQDWKGYGTGFAINKNIIVTACHVISDAKSVEVKFPNTDWLKATVIKGAQSVDLAILQIDTPIKDWISISSDEPSVKVGAKVFTIGYPAISILGTEAKYTEGTVSSLSGLGNDDLMMQITVPIQPGNSGGPLFNEDGQLIGVTVATVEITNFVKYTGTIPQNVNWAVKLDYLYPMIKKYTTDNPAKPKKGEIIDYAKSATCLIRAK